MMPPVANSPPTRPPATVVIPPRKAMARNDTESSTLNDDAEMCVRMIQKAGFAAVRSSVHVNFGPPHFDKLSACTTLVRQVLKADPADLQPYVYVGDALNDAPMFRGFPNSVGVANVKQYWDELSSKPAFLTEKPEGPGLRELVEHLLTLSR